jgi:hypothetical protein
MQVRRLTQNTRPTSSNGNKTAQRAADYDSYQTAVSLACSSQSIATISPTNISHVNKLYTQPVPPQNHPTPPTTTPHQPYSLPGDICKTILHAAKNKGTSVNADSIDLFTTLVKCKISTIKHDLHFIFLHSSLTSSTKTSSHNPSNVTLQMSTCSASTRTSITPPNFALLVSQPPSEDSLLATSPVHYMTNSWHISYHITTLSASQTAAILSSRQCNSPSNDSSTTLNNRRNYQHMPQSFLT